MGKRHRLKVSKAEHGSIPGPQGLGDEREVVGRFVAQVGCRPPTQLQIILRLLQGFRDKGTSAPSTVQTLSAQ